jgi:hypothetical protein
MKRAFQPGVACLLLAHEGLAVLGGLTHLVGGGWIGTDEYTPLLRTDRQTRAALNIKEIPFK